MSQVLRNAERERKLEKIRGKAKRQSAGPKKAQSDAFDPESATDALKLAVLELERSLTIYPWKPGYADELRVVRDAGWKAIHGVQDWKARGGSVPRRFWYTWIPRFDAVLVAQRDTGGIASGR